MRVLVIPVKEDEKEDKKPVAVVEPTGPTLEKKTKIKSISNPVGKVKGKGSKAKRLDSVLNGIYAKKGVKSGNGSDNSGGSEGGSPGRENGGGRPDTPGSPDEDRNDDFCLTQNSEAFFSMKTKDGESKQIKILQRLNNTDDIDSFKRAHPSSVRYHISS